MTDCPSPRTVFAILIAAASAALTGCASPNAADVERFDQDGSNEVSPLSWSSDEVQLSDADRVVVVRGGEPAVVLELETCGRPIVDGGTIELGVEDDEGCVARVIYSEMLHECESCDGLGGAIVGGALHGLFGGEHRWGSVEGTASIDVVDGTANISVEANMRPLSISLGENTAEGRFGLRSSIFMSDFGAQP